MFTNLRRIPLLVVGIFLITTALSACGGSESETSRTRNAVVVPTCAEGGDCVVGDIGPGGGVVFVDLSSERDPGTYLEVAPAGWGDPEMWPTDPKARLCVDATMCPERLSRPSTAMGEGREAWDKISAQECDGCAQNLLRKLNEGDIKDWFLPNTKELQAVFDSGINRPLTTEEPYFSIGTSVLTSRALRFPTLMFRPGKPKASPEWVEGVEQLHVVPIRKFFKEQLSVNVKSDEELRAEYSLLKPITNLRVKFENSLMVFDFDLQKEGPVPQLHFVKLHYKTFGYTSFAVAGTATSGSTSPIQWSEGTQVSAFVDSHIYAINETFSAQSEEIEFTIPQPEALPGSSPVATPTDESVKDEISNLGQPIINVPSGGSEGEIDPQSLIKNLTNVLPDTNVEKIEIQIVSPSSSADNQWQAVSTDTPTPYSIPTDATGVNLRITTSDGTVIEQEKLVVHTSSRRQTAVPSSSTSLPTPQSTVKKPTVPSSTSVPSEQVDGEDADSADSNVTSSTAPDEEFDTPAENSTDGSAGGNSIVWFIIAILALLAAAFGAVKIRKNKS
jgi:hypothetical protein